MAGFLISKILIVLEYSLEIEISFSRIWEMITTGKQAEIPGQTRSEIAAGQPIHTRGMPLQKERRKFGLSKEDSRSATWAMSISLQPWQQTP